MSTILDWLDLEIPLQCDGRSLLSATEGGQLPLLGGPKLIGNLISAEHKVNHL
ncbi:MAG: hypothetical protein CM1200mP9_11600 [Gammaproteobacteria bacterium]|nr:MAG: hypothetical protein CM1200mP9_11600 [Gammaproteobacteria bacterium]